MIAKEYTGSAFPETGTEFSEVAYPSMVRIHSPDSDISEVSYRKPDIESPAINRTMIA